MELLDFLRHIQDSKAHVSSVVPSVWSFTGTTYPLLFFSRFFTRLQVVRHEQVIVLDVTQYELGSIYAHCQTSFLGVNVLYWLKNLSILDEAQRTQLIAYVKDYTGPHALSFFLDAPISSASLLSIQLPERLDRRGYKELFHFFQGTYCQDTQFITSLFKHHETLTLDEASLMLCYQSLGGRRPENFINRWLNKIITPKRSLFTLSRLFFAKHYDLFLQEWLQCEGNYPEEFWIHYWSDQLWQACMFLSCVEKVGKEAAKKMVYRIPFSLSDIQHVSRTELIVAHDFLYALDYRLKNGTVSCALDLFYFKFLFGHFKR